MGKDAVEAPDVSVAAAAKGDPEEGAQGQKLSRAISRKQEGERSHNTCRPLSPPLPGSGPRLQPEAFRRGLWPGSSARAELAAAANLRTPPPPPPRHPVALKLQPLLEQPGSGAHAHRGARPSRFPVGPWPRSLRPRES